MFDFEGGTYSVSESAVVDFYRKAAAKVSSEPVPWDQLSAEQRALYQEMMTTAVVDDFPVFFTLKPKARDDFRCTSIVDVDVPVPALEATTEGDITIAREVLRWRGTEKGVLMPRDHGVPVLLGPSHWGPTRSLQQASWLLDWLKEQGWLINLFDYRGAKRVKQNGWWFELDRFDPPDINGETEGDTSPTHYYTLDDGAPTLPLAICRAALAAAQWMAEHPDDFPDWLASEPYRLRGEV